MDNYNTMSTTLLVDKFTKLDKESKDVSIAINNIKAELQRRGLKHLEYKQLKTVQYFGSDANYVLVQKTEKLDTINYLTLKNILRSLSEEYITKEQVVNYKFKPNLKNGLTSIFTNNYETRSVEDILKEMGMSGTTLELAQKKLKGTWVKDKELLESLGFTEDIELYLYFIHQAINYNKLETILLGSGYSKEEIPRLIPELKKAIMVEENTKISIKYDK